MKLGAAVRSARLKADLSRATLAERAGVRVSYVAALERGQANPPLDVLVRLAATLNVSVVSFFRTRAPRKKKG